MSEIESSIWAQAAAGVVPKKMMPSPCARAASANRDAWKREVLDIPIRDDEVRLRDGHGHQLQQCVGCPGNAGGRDCRTAKGARRDGRFSRGGSDCSGIVWAIGKDVKNVKVGDPVVVHSGGGKDDPWVLSGKDPMLAKARASGAIKPTMAATASSRARRPPVHSEAENLTGKRRLIFAVRVDGISHADGMVAEHR